eukprot:2589325-Prymnesium_polylepis.1
MCLCSWPPSRPAPANGCSHWSLHLSSRRDVRRYNVWPARLTVPSLYSSSPCVGGGSRLRSVTSCASAARSLTILLPPRCSVSRALELLLSTSSSARPPASP